MTPVAKKHKTVKKSASHAKHVTLHHHHHKPFRKRHVSLLTLSLVGLVVALVLLVQYRDVVMTGVNVSRNFISDVVSDGQNYDRRIASTYGFAMTYDTRELYANAVDGKSGKIYQDRELLRDRTYSKMQFAPLDQSNVTDQSAVSVSYHPEISGSLSSEAVQDLVFRGGSIKKDDVKFVTSEKVKIGGQDFEKSVWQSKTSVGPLHNLLVSYSVYSANINGHPLTVTVNEGFVDIPGTHPQYDDLIQSLEFMPQTAKINNQQVTRSSVGDSIIDTILMAKTASAQSATSKTSVSERVAALYSPAVVRVYNAYCTNIEFEGEAFLRDACLSGSGSGFLVSQDGYVATNGHVVSMNARDISIYNAFVYVAAGDSGLINYLAAKSGFKATDVPEDSTQTEAIGILIEKLYEIDESLFTLTDSVQNLLVALGDKKPDTDKLLADTQARTKHESDTTIKPATVKATDFRLVDGINGFHASDVAIIKMEGKNFPIVTLGSIDDVNQGEELSILGFPGNANENNIVDSESSTATLTTGKVSSKKKAAGTENMLIETDTTIGHGNSGGPAFGNRGTVVGIATYTLDGSGSGDGTYNYIRDIKDLVDLASKESITFDTNSQTQTEWEQGIDYFYESRLSKALVNFEKVRELYPNHAKVAEFIASANKRIANGEDVQDFPVVVVGVGAVMLLVVVVGGAFLIVHHHKKHKVYNAGVAQGTVSPYEKGVPADPQQVSVTHPNVHPVHPGENPGQANQVDTLADQTNVPDTSPSPASQKKPTTISITQESSDSDTPKDPGKTL